jgi:hypothetical protein
MSRPIVPILLVVCLLLPVESLAASGGAEGPALGAFRIIQPMVAGGELSRTKMRREGRRIFSTPFNLLDGLGDGPMDPNDTTAPGGRPSLQANGMFLRVNGLDSQSCLECHSVLSNATIPARFAVGGAGGVSANAMSRPTAIDVDDSQGNGFAGFNGRFINPPFLFGAGGVELLGKEMTEELQGWPPRPIPGPSCRSSPRV